MFNDRSYFIVDGSHLFSSVHALWREKPEFNNHKLNIGKMSEALIRKWSINIGVTVRIILYFKKSDNRIKTMLTVPRSDSPGEKNHWLIKECGQSLKTIPEEQLQLLESKYRDQFQRQEKGLDIKLACDSLMLVSQGKANNLVFLVNDRDYVPLLETVHDLGGNVYLTALDSSQGVQKDLANLADRYLTLDDELGVLFDLEPADQPEIEVVQEI